MLMIPGDEAHVASFVHGAGGAVEQPEAEVAAALRAVYQSLARLPVDAEWHAYLAPIDFLKSRFAGPRDRKAIARLEKLPW